MKQQARHLNVIASELQTAMRAESSSIIAIGRLLIEARAQLEHGQWLEWLGANFDRSIRSAENYMSAATFVSKIETSKIATVANIRPSALYLLASLDDVADRDLIEAVLKEAESGWVTEDRVWQIRAELPPTEAEIAAGIEAEKKREEWLETEKKRREELDALLDGPPPELPPAEEPAKPDVVLPPFDQAIKTLAGLQTKPLGKFAGTTHTARDLHAVGDFLHAVAERKGAADAQPADQPQAKLH
jgi:hypothetical protein